jgi:hypothetical protein
MGPAVKNMMRRTGRAAVPCVAAVCLAIVMTWPLASGLDRLGRIGGDGEFSIWNVAWVAHALVTSPTRVYDANIFYPHPHALAFSEANLVAGALAAPAWLLTRNAYVAHNTAVLLAFGSAALGAWLLARRLTGGDNAAAAVAALLFAFCPYVFSHTAHIQLLMSGGIPLSMLMLHRLVDAPSHARAVALGLAIATQALACAYYGIFAGLMVGYATLFFAASRGLWHNRHYWLAIGIAAATALLCTIPFFIPYLTIQELGFARTIEDAVRYSANPHSYLASSAHAHQWILKHISGWGEVLFPGYMALVFGAAGLVGAVRRSCENRTPSGDRETALLYASLGVLAFWASFGPAAGLYSVLFRIPVFSFLRAPSRFGLVVSLTLAVLSSLALKRLLDRLPQRWRGVTAAGLAAIALAELNVLPFPWNGMPQPPAVYKMLAMMPRGPLAEFPFYSVRVTYPLHAQYMVFSTTHWMPMLNGYSDHIPAEFRQDAPVLGSFPSVESFQVLKRRRVRYIGVHWDAYLHRAPEIRQRLEPFTPHLRPLAATSVMTLYEIVSFP